jgi:hypothetical protein
MPVEIKELHIRVAVDARPPAKGASNGGAQGESGGQGSGGGQDKDAIVAECVEQVLQILQARKER